MYGPVFLYRGRVMVPYSKPYLTIQEQLSLLRGRGLDISDEPRAEAALQRIGYYRLSGYWYPLRKSIPIIDPMTGREVIQVLDEFRPGASFASVLDLYVFDKKLRLLFLDAIERIEIGLRVDVALQMGRYDLWAHRCADLLHPRFARQKKDELTDHQRWLNKLDASELSSKESFASHFKQKYGGPLPLWMAVELWDFGRLSHFMAGMRDADLDPLAASYGLPRRTLLTSGVRAINHVRNICAHHGRLWNRPPADQPRLPRPGEVPVLDHLIWDNLAQTRLYAVAAMIRLLMRRINPSSSWAERLKAHVETFPPIPGVTFGQSGFPPGWQSLSLWR